MLVTKTFEASTLREAMRAIQSELGPEAVILSTKPVRDRRSGRSVGFEVTARGRPEAGRRHRRHQAMQLSAQRPVPGGPGERGYSGLSGGPKRSSTRRRSRSDSRPAASRTGGSESVSRLQGEIDELRELIGDVVQATRGSGEARAGWGDLRREIEDLVREVAPTGVAVGEDDGLVGPLLQQGVDAAIARALAYRAKGRTAPSSGLAVAKEPDLTAEVAEAIPVAEPLWSRGGRGERATLALIGPAGAGKTSTLAKVAWMAIREHGRRVAVIATDANRVGRVEPIRHHVERLRIPLKLARGRHELMSALAELHDRDLVLIDTAGVRPWDDSSLFAMDALLDDPSIERHLVIPATWRSSELSELVRRHSRVGAESLVMTRLDEARSHSAVLAATWESRIPISHLCAGPRVPDDIAAADRRAIAERIVLKAA